MADRIYEINNNIQFDHISVVPAETVPEHQRFVNAQVITDEEQLREIYGMPLPNVNGRVYNQLELTRALHSAHLGNSVAVDVYLKLHLPVNLINVSMGVAPSIKKCKRVIAILNTKLNPQQPNN